MPIGTKVQVIINVGYKGDGTTMSDAMNEQDDVVLTDEQVANRMLWLGDLLSGNYEQGFGRLKVIDRQDNDAIKYCCLGVACERFDPESEFLVIDSGNIMSNGAYLRQSVGVEKLGMTEGDQQVAGQWNDAQSFTYARIADLVAYSTENRMNFYDVNPRDVPMDYARGWLANQGSK